MYVGEGTSLSRSTICVYSSTLCSVNLKNHKEKKKTPRGQSRAALHSLILFIFPSSNRLHSFCLILYIAALHSHFFTRSASHVPITCPFPVKLSFCLLYLWGHKTRQLIESTLHVALWLIAWQSDTTEGVAAVNQFTSEETNCMVESICLYNIDYHFLKINLVKCVDTNKKRINFLESWRSFQETIDWNVMWLFEMTKRQTKGSLTVVIDELKEMFVTWDTEMKR